MLVLSRHEDQVIMIGDDIVVGIKEILDGETKVFLVLPHGVSAMFHGTDLNRPDSNANRIHDPTYGAGIVVNLRRDESVIVNGNITILIVDIRGVDKVRLGFEAPSEIPIHRREVYDAIRRESPKPT